MGRVAGKVAFITGAARGQGRSQAVRLAEEGADIIAVDICEKIPHTVYEGATEEDLAETVRQVEKLGRRIVARKADVRHLAAMEQVLAEGVGQLGRLDIVCANAGVFTAPGPAESLGEDVWDDMLAINLTGAWKTVRAALPHLRSGGRGGTVIFINSGAGTRGYPNIAHYVSAKHGLLGLMKSLALELAPEHIRVNSILPTQVDTAMIQNEATYRLFAPHADPPTKEMFAAVSGSTMALPVPWVDPADTANALLFLASDEAQHITGVALPVDAGHLVK